MRETKRRKITIDPKLLRCAQRSAIKILIELKHTHGLDPTPLLTGQFFSRSRTSCALKKTHGKSNTRSLYNTLVAGVHGDEAFAAIGKLQRPLASRG